jgi:dTDP-4-dehydrorhamnose reductase
MKILLLGAGGLLGRYLARELADHDLTAVTRREADITNGDRLDGLFAPRWEAVINAAAVCDFDACEKDPAGTGRVNREAPLELARRCAAQGSLFVQYSSDYVFAGDEGRWYTETDIPRPLSVYGQQKADVEKLVPDLCPRSLLLRVSWVYGLGGKTFMSRLPDLLSDAGILRTAAGKKGCCLYAADGAFWTRRLVEAGHTGLFNLVNSGETSWEEFARATLEQMMAQGPAPGCTGIEEVPYTQLGPGWTKRPRRSGLDPARLAALCPPGPRPWREALRAFLAEWKSVAAPRTV